jgi:hypothetical protein
MAIFGAAQTNADPSRQPHDHHSAAIMVVDVPTGVCHRETSFCRPAVTRTSNI